MFLILISQMFAFFKRLISAKPQCSRGGGGGGGYSVISVYLYTLIVFHRKLTFYCEMNVTGVTIPG